MQTGYLIASASVALVAIASLAERQRNRRNDLDAVGFVPWPMVSIIGMITALFATALALKGVL
ncbi:MAG: hypothetical protein K2X31_00630 [Sphingopyxis sp.]|nr:hypothetical protein [Sphingopyxis sp.]